MTTIAHPLPTLTEDEVTAALGGLEQYRHQCHAASLALVRSGLLGEHARVARGSVLGVRGQHSWAVIGDPYDPLAPVVDVTAWSYDVTRQGQPVPFVWITTGAAGGHRPHGSGHIFDAARPLSGGKEEVALTPTTPLSGEAEHWLRIFHRNADGPLDARFWMMLANGPMEGWPAAEFITAMHDTPGIACLIPIDIVGMLTDRNPGGLYR